MIARSPPGRGAPRRHRRRRILGLGLATGGWVDSPNGTIVEHPALGWRDVRIGAALAESTGLPVRADNNSRALLRAELLFGAVAGRAPGERPAPVRRQRRRRGVRRDRRRRTPRTAVGFGSGGPPVGRGLPGGLLVRPGRRLPAGGRLGAGAGPAGAGHRADRSAGHRGAGAGGGRRSAGEPLELLRDRARLVGRAAALLLDLFDPEVLVVPPRPRQPAAGVPGDAAGGGGGPGRRRRPTWTGWCTRRVSRAPCWRWPAGPSPWTRCSVATGPRRATARVLSSQDLIQFGALLPSNPSCIV